MTSSDVVVEVCVMVIVVLGSIYVGEHASGVNPGAVCNHLELVTEYLALPL